MLYTPLAFISLGYGNALCSNKVKLITIPNMKRSARLVKEARENDKFLDLTRGKKTKCIIVMDDGTVVSTFFSPKTVLDRLTRSALEFIVDIEQRREYGYRFKDVEDTNDDEEEFVDEEEEEVGVEDEEEDEEDDE